jgi:hypothetical protein
MVALRLDPRGRGTVAAAPLDEPTLAAALERAGLPGAGDAGAVARHVLGTLAGEQGR